MWAYGAHKAVLTRTGVTRGAPRVSLTTKSGTSAWPSSLGTLCLMRHLLSCCRVAMPHTCRPRNRPAPLARKYAFETPGGRNIAKCREKVLEPDCHTCVQTLPLGWVLQVHATVCTSVCYACRVPPLPRFFWSMSSPESSMKGAHCSTDSSAVLV